MPDKRKKPPVFRQQTIPLAPNHGWRCSAGHKLCIVGRGDLRFEYPDTWVNSFGEMGSLKLHERPFPNDDIMMEISVLHSPRPVDPSRFPELDDLLRKSLVQRGRVLGPDTVRPWQSPGVLGAWVEYDSPEDDPKTGQKRLATWRHLQCHPGAHFLGAQLPIALITFGFWSEHRDKADPVWEHLLATIVMGEKIEDPRVGPRYN